MEQEQEQVEEVKSHDIVKTIVKDSKDMEIEVYEWELNSIMTVYPDNGERIVATGQLRMSTDYYSDVSEGDIISSGRGDWWKVLRINETIVSTIIDVELVKYSGRNLNVRHAKCFYKVNSILLWFYRALFGFEH